MGSSDPLLARFEIRFGSLNFQATGNDYLMRITNRDELCARRPTGPDPVPVAPAAGAPAFAQVDAAGPPAPRRRRRSVQRSRQARTEHQRAVQVASQRDATTGETATAPTGERSVSGLRFPIGLRGAMTAYVASANTDAVARRARPSRHAPVVRNPSASTDDESSHDSASELPPATSHGYAEWDFSGVPDPVLFRRFLPPSHPHSRRPVLPQSPCRQTLLTAAGAPPSTQGGAELELPCPQLPQAVLSGWRPARRLHQCYRGRSRGTRRPAVPSFPPMASTQ
jgi:hypothetical protein